MNIINNSQFVGNKMQIEWYNILTKKLENENRRFMFKDVSIRFEY